MAKEETKKTKRPTALKRDIQNEKKKLINKTFKSRVRTATRSFDSALEAKDKEMTQEKLSAVYSAIDKGVKKGIFKRNKADRMKARATKKAAAQA